MPPLFVLERGSTDFYFSGVRSRREVDWLLDAGVERIMVDPLLDIDLVDDMIGRWDQAGLSLELALDSGAYRVWKGGIRYSGEQFLEFLRRHGDRFVLAMSLDSIGNHIMSYHNYVQILAYGYDVVPVWHWGTPKTYLHDYLDMSPIVAIGKLVPPMRDQDTQMLAALRRLCEKYPNRFHLLGLCWPKAIDALHRDGTVYSADSSEWLVGARRGLVLFQHTGHMRFTRAPYKVLPFSRDWDRRERCVGSARNLRTFLSQPRPQNPEDER